MRLRRRSKPPFCFVEAISITLPHLQHPKRSAPVALLGPTKCAIRTALSGTGRMAIAPNFKEIFNWAGPEPGPRRLLISGEQISRGNQGKRRKAFYEYGR